MNLQVVDRHFRVIVGQIGPAYLCSLLILFWWARLPLWSCPGRYGLVVRACDFGAKLSDKVCIVARVVVVERSDRLGSCRCAGSFLRRRRDLDHLALLLLLEDPLAHNLLMVGLRNKMRLNRVFSYLDSDVVIRAHLMILWRSSKGWNISIRWAIDTAITDIVDAANIIVAWVTTDAHSTCCASVVHLLWIDRTVCTATDESHIDVRVTLTVFFTLIDLWHLMAILTVLEVVMMAAIMRVTLLVKIIKDWWAILLDFDYVLVADCQELDYLCQDTSAICIDQARDHLVGNVASRSSQHLFELGGWETLDDHVLLSFLSLILSLEVNRVVLLNLIRRVNLWQISIHVLLSQIDVLQKALPSFFHFNETTFESLPQFVIGSPSHITRVPDVVLDELFDLMLPLWLEHHLLDRLHCDHEPMYVLNQNVIACYEKLLAAMVALANTWQICSRLQYRPSLTSRVRCPTRCSAREWTCTLTPTSLRGRRNR